MANPAIHSLTIRLPWAAESDDGDTHNKPNKAMFFTIIHSDNSHLTLYAQETWLSALRCHDDSSDDRWILL